MSDRVYNLLKNIALIVLPALATLVLTIFKIWNLPLGEEIAATITALDVFLGALLKISSNFYNQKKELEEKIKEKC